MENDLLSLRAAIERFVKLPETDWELLVPHVTQKTLDKQSQFVSEGKRSSEVAFILQGSLRQFYTTNGEEKSTYFYFAGDIACSYVSCITRKPSLLTIEALTAVNYLSFPYPILTDLYQKSHAWHTFGRLIAEYIAMGLEERMVSLLLQSPEERYVSLINSHRKKIIEQIPQQYIANYLGITPVSMSRIRKRLISK